MIFELIATVVAGLAAAGVALILGRLSGGRLPRWTAPAVAGMAMIAFAIGSEYAWFDRTRNALPEPMVVVRTGEAQTPYRPWTYAVPYIDRFAAIDPRSIRRHEGAPEQRMVDMLFFGRWAPVRRVPTLVDCAAARQAALVEGVRLAPDGGVANASWRGLAGDDPVLSAVCEES